MTLNRAALESLAESVGDGAPIAWEAIEAQASETERPIIRQLRVLEDLAHLHRTLPVETAGPRPQGPTGRSSSAPAIGTWGHLALLERLGGGAFGEVYRAWDAQLERDVALKVLRGDAPDASRLLNEARLLARIHHPHVVTVHGVDTQEGRAGLWMELVDGVSLEQVLASQGPFSAREAALVGIDLCGALAALHAKGLVHRDVKAQNVMREDRRAHRPDGPGDGSRRGPRRTHRGGRRHAALPRARDLHRGGQPAPAATSTVSACCSITS